MHLSQYVIISRNTFFFFNLSPNLGVSDMFSKIKRILAIDDSIREVDRI